MIYGYIYKLYCITTGECYIGSTKNLKRRIIKHRIPSNKNISKNILERKNYIFLILQEGKYINLDHLRAIENSYIEKLDCINKIRSFFNTNEQQKIYNEKNKDKIKEQRKLYLEKNKDKIKERQKIYYIKNQDKIIEFRKNNHDKIKEQHNKWYQKNKDKYNEKKRKNYQEAHKNKSQQE